MKMVTDGCCMTQILKLVLSEQQMITVRCPIGIKHLNLIFDDWFNFFTNRPIIMQKAKSSNGIPFEAMDTLLFLECGLMAQIAPKGGRITGTSSVMKMNGWNWEDAAQLH